MLDTVASQDIVKLIDSSHSLCCQVVVCGHAVPCPKPPCKNHSLQSAFGWSCTGYVGPMDHEEELLSCIQSMAVYS